jgi:hypothetical protein
MSHCGFERAPDLSYLRRSTRTLAVSLSLFLDQRGRELLEPTVLPTCIACKTDISVMSCTKAPEHPHLLRNVYESNGLAMVERLILSALESYSTVIPPRDPP